MDCGQRSLFINTKEMLVKWGTKSPILIPAPGLPGGMPIRAFGTFACKVADYDRLIEKVAGIKLQFTVEDVKERITSMLDQLLMKWIAKEGKDMFNLQVNADAIGRGIREDLDMEMQKIGIGIERFAISSFNYPEQVTEDGREGSGTEHDRRCGTIPAGNYGRGYGQWQGRQQHGFRYGRHGYGYGHGTADGGPDDSGHERRSSAAGSSTAYGKCRRSGTELLPQLRNQDKRCELLPQLRTEAGIGAGQKLYQKSSDRKNNEGDKRVWPATIF